MTNNNDIIRLIFGLKLKVLRQQRNINYQQLSDMTGIAVSYLHGIENGKKYPKADKIIVLAKALNVEYDYLVSLTANKRLQPIIDLLNSDFAKLVPWEHLGVQPTALFDLFAETPDKMTAFISTILKIARSVQVSKDDFYMSALRSYQDIHDNYFEDLENAAQQLRERHALKGTTVLNVEALEGVLSKAYGIKVDRKTMHTKEALKGLRSYYAKAKKVLYLNKNLSTAQEKFLLAREIAFQDLQFAVRPYETVLQDFVSFDTLLNNFKASYFASALLLPEDSFTEDIRLVFLEQKWNEKVWLDLIDKYDVTPEMFMQRLTNILPKHFGIDQLFFLRLSGSIKDNTYEITKELHLSKLHNPYANALNEHYCRRWVAISLMKEVHQKAAAKKYKQPLVAPQISQYWQTHNRYLCITIAKPHPKHADKITSVTLGLLIDRQLLQRIPFVNDLSIPVKTVHTTCERCSISDCQERAMKAIIVEQQDEKARVEEALSKLG